LPKCSFEEALRHPKTKSSVAELGSMHSASIQIRYECSTHCEFITHEPKVISFHERGNND
jgi:hypothetical protein